MSANIYSINSERNIYWIKGKTSICDFHLNFWSQIFFKEISLIWTLQNTTMFVFLPVESSLTCKKINHVKLLLKSDGFKLSSCQFNFERRIVLYIFLCFYWGFHPIFMSLPLQSLLNSWAGETDHIGRESLWGFIFSLMREWSLKGEYFKGKVGEGQPHSVAAPTH